MASDLVLFKDIYKPWKDFNTKGFDAEETKFQFKTSGKDKVDATVNYGKSTYEVLLEFARSFRAFPLTLKAKATSDDEKLELTLEHKRDGNTLTTVGTTSRHKPPTFSLSFTHEFASVHPTFTVDIKDKVPTLGGVVVFGVAGFVFGGKVTHPLVLPVSAPPTFESGAGGHVDKKSEKEGLKWSVGARKDFDGHRFGVTADEKVVTAGYLLKLRDGHTVGAQAEYYLQEDKKKNLFPGDYGVAIAWEDPSKSAPIKARLQPLKGILQFSFGQIIAPHLKATLSTDVSLLKAGEAKFGVSVLYDETI